MITIDQNNKGIGYYNCLMCGCLVMRNNSDYKPKSGGYFCSRECWHLFQNTTTAKKLHYCEFCGSAFFDYKKAHRKYCCQKCAKKAQTLPRSQDSRLIEYCYKLVGESLINRIISYKARKNNLHSELKFVALDTIQKFLVSPQFKQQLANYISSALSGHLKRTYKENSRQQELLSKYIDNRTYDELAEIADLK